MPIDLAQVDWLYVAVLAVFALFATVVANLLSFGHRGFAAVLAAVVFTGIFVFWTYYPHGLPLPTSLAGPRAPAATVAPLAPMAPAAPARPNSPIRDITPPTNN